MVELTATLTCPRCSHSSTETMPTDRCVFFYECAACGSVLKPKPNDCCVFCSHADRPCPGVQASRDQATRADSV
jgi:Zn ribbon nucleic-acid-binding protein